jgi:hypothetical protein
VPSNSVGDAVGERSQGHALLPVPTALELPRREAPDVDVVLIQTRVVAVIAELDLELHLVRRDRQGADRARSTDSWAAPSAVRSAVRELAGFQYFPGLGAYSLLFHLAGLFDVLIVRDTDRLSRDDMEPDPVVTLKSAGVTVWEYSTGGPVDVSDATDRLVRNVHRYRGASEAESGSRRTRESKFAKARTATIADGRVLGYRNTGDPKHRTREIDPEQAKLVVRIFKLAADGAGYLKIVRTLNAA